MGKRVRRPRGRRTTTTSVIRVSPAARGLHAGRRVAGQFARRPLQPAEQVLLELLVLPDFRVVAERGVEDLALPLLAAPGDCVVLVVASEVRAWVERARVDAENDVEFLA